MACIGPRESAPVPTCGRATHRGPLAFSKCSLNYGEHDGCCGTGSRGIPAYQGCLTRRNRAWSAFGNHNWESRLERVTMFALLSELIVHFINQISGQIVSSAATNISQRRNILSRLIKLFDALSELENELSSVYNEFSRHLKKADASSKASVLELEKSAASKLKQLNDAFKNYMKAMEEIGQLLRLYDVRLYVHLSGLVLGKTGLWEGIVDKIDLSDEITPRLVIGDDEKFTFYVTFPTSIPDEIGKPLRYPELSSTELKRRIPLIREEMIKKFNKQSIEFRDPKGLARALQTGEACIINIREAREMLGKLIRENFPLDRLIA